MKLAAVWLLLGAVTAAVMLVGFRSNFERLTPRLWAHAALAVITWPIGLLSAMLMTRYPNASRVVERLAGGGIIDAFFDWRDLRALRRRGGDGGSLAYLKRDLQGVDSGGNFINLAAYEDVVMDPEVYVQCGGRLPPGRPEGDALIRVQRGVAAWETS